MGFDRSSAPATGTRLPRVALAAAVRSHEIDVGRWAVDAPGVGQLGRSQFAAELRVQRRMLQSGIGDVPRRSGPIENESVATAQSGGFGRTQLVRKTSRRRRGSLFAVPLITVPGDFRRHGRYHGDGGWP